MERERIHRNPYDLPTMQAIMNTGSKAKTISQLKEATAFKSMVDASTQPLIQIYKRIKQPGNSLRRIFLALPAAVQEKTVAEIMQLPRSGSYIPPSELGEEAQYYFPVSVYEILRSVVPAYQQKGASQLATFEPLLSSTPIGQLSDVEPDTPVTPSASASTSVQTFRTAQSHPSSAADISTPARTTAIRRKGVLKLRKTSETSTPMNAPTPQPPRRLFTASVRAPVRHRRVLLSNKLSKGAVRRLARRGGVVRLSAGMAAETNKIFREFLTGLIRDVVTYTEHANRRTVTISDVLQAVKKQSLTLYI